MRIFRFFSLFLLFSLLSLCIAACSDTQSTPATNNQPALLGSPLSAFDAKFGSRGTGYQDKGGSYTWNVKYGKLDLNVDTLNSVTFTDAEKNLVNGLMFTFPYNSEATNIPVLTNKAATELSNEFLPPDAVHKNDVVRESFKAAGEAILIKTYFSPQLAKVLPASSFVDRDGNRLQRGLITILFSLENEDKNQVSDVTVQAGEELPGGYNP